MLLISPSLCFGSNLCLLSSLHFLVSVRPYYHERTPRWLPRPCCAAANSQMILLVSSGGDYDEDDANVYVDTTNRNINGPYLDEETYLQAENNLLRPDGSLGLSSSVTTIKNKTYQAVTEGLLSPAPSYAYVDDAPHDRSNGSVLSDEERLYRAVVNGKVDATNDNMIDPETLHREVFAEEEAYLQQSQQFRKALSSMTKNDESPMAKDRREEIERYNEKVLIDLIKEMDEMEALAVSREEAIGSPIMDEKEAMMKRAETIRSTDEAKVRTAMWTPGSTSSYNGGASSSSRMFDKKTQQWPKSNEVYKWRKDAAGKWRKVVIDDQKADNRRSSVAGVNTSSLFDMPKKRSDDYSAVSSTPIDVAPLKVQQITNDRLSSTIAPDIDRQRSPPSRRISPMLGGLAQRMQQRDSESRSQENQIHTDAQSKEKRKQSQTQRIVVDESSLNAKLANDSINEHEVMAAANNDHINSSWVKIEDSDSKRTLFWNTESGEMKNTM